MKASRFNVFFEYEGSRMGFNSFSQEFILLDPLLVELYNNGSVKEDFSELEEIHPDFYNFLIQQGFLVDDTIDEFDVVKTLSEKVDNDSSGFHLIVNPTMNCNFKCWYCYETHIKDSKMDSQTIDATSKIVNNVIKNQEGLKRFHLSFFGGEPLLYFHKVVDPILRHAWTVCNENNIEFRSSMTTNGLLIDQNMLDVCTQYGLDGFQITLDGNRERHDKVRFISEGRGSYDKIVSNIKLAAQNGCFVNVRINCSPETMDGVNEVILDFDDMPAEARKNLQFHLFKVWQVAEKIETQIDATVSYFRDQQFSAHGGGEAVSILQSCYADKRYQATVNYNGEVFKCTARDFKSGTNEGMLNSDGSIEWNEKYENRLNSKFKNPPCKECKILPICGGGCTQQAIEHQGKDYCVYNFDEDEKTRVVINKFVTMMAEADLVLE